MKKYLLVISSLISIYFTIWYQTQATNLSDFTPLIDKKIANMKTTEEKVKFLDNFVTTLNSPTFTKNKNAEFFREAREYTLNMLNVFQYQLLEEQSAKKSKTTVTQPNKASKNTSNKKTSINKSSSKSLPQLSDNFHNIDIDKIRKEILSWHNDERKSLWRNLYTYNIDLEWSATVRANNLASSWKTKNLHLRNSWDWSYNYTSILNWFSDLWINFPASVKWAASFSESIWYWYYKCSSSDCTQTLINSIKKTWTNLIMKEKSYNWDHYRAAVMKHFTQMWIWISIDYSLNRYYLVLEYWVDF